MHVDGFQAVWEGRSMYKCRLFCERFFVDVGRTITFLSGVSYGGIYYFNGPIVPGPGQQRSDCSGDYLLGNQGRNGRVLSIYFR